MTLPRRILIDLQAKACTDISETLQRTLALVDDPVDRAAIVVGSLCAIYRALFEMVREDKPDRKQFVCNTLIETLRSIEKAPDVPQAPLR